MTFPPFSLFRNTCNRAGLLLLLLASSCSGMGDSLLRPSERKAGESVTREKKRQRIVSDNYEWAVQNFEAGEYDKAIALFRRLEAEGPGVENYELIPFYLGMSFFQKSEYATAVSHLEAFLRSQPDHREAQDARVALLTIFERQEKWDRVLGLAAEMDKTTLYQNNRAFLKLVWARALQERGELKGAKSVLDEAAQFLVSQSTKPVDRDKDLWGRFYYTDLMQQRASCASAPPRKSAKGGRHYETWLDASVDCYRRLIDQFANNLVRAESTWVEAGVDSLSRSMEAFGREVQGFMREERARLAVKRQLEEQSRRQLYRLLGKMDETLKIFKNHNVNPTSFENLRKRVDLLLVSLSQPS